MDTDALTALLRRHAGLIHKVAHAYCREPADREDVVQEIAVQLWRARDRYDPRFRETTWIYRIALNVAISYFRRERRHRGARVPLEDVPIAVEPVDLGGELALLFRCIDELGPLDRALVVLYLDGNDHAQIAEVVGTSPSNVGTRLHRIKDRLRTALKASVHPEVRHGAR